MEKKEQPGDKKVLLPWMPYVFGFIFLLGAVGLYILSGEAPQVAVQAAAIPAIPAVPAAPQVPIEEQIIAPVKQMLDAIKEKKLHQAYDLGSSDFQLAMTYGNFAHFVGQYDALNLWTTVSFSEPQVEKHVASVTAYLHYDGEEEVLPISFTLVQENGAWKIYGFIINATENNLNIKEIEQLKDLIHSVNEELGLLKNGTYQEAYALTTPRFQAKNPYEKFVDFMEQNRPFIEQQGATFSEGNIEGNRGDLRVTLYSEEETVPVDFKLEKENGIWKIDEIKVVLPSHLLTPLNPKQVEESLEVLSLFLKTIRKGLDEKAYVVFTSDQFQHTTSLSEFEAFIHEHPVLQEKTEPKYLDGGKKGNERIIYLLYGKPPFRLAFEIRLVEEGKEWKIEGITLEKPESEADPHQMDQAQVLDLTEAVLNLLGNREYEAFYRDAASTGFKRTTSYEAFTHYLEKHPVLTSHPKVFLEEVAQDRKQLMVEANLVDPHYTNPTLISFIYEKGGWKVLRLETKADKQIAEATGQPIIELSQVLVGQDVDDLGMIQDAGKTLLRDDQPIYLTILLTTSRPSAEVTVELLHEESRSTSPTATGKAHDEGNNILTFTFTPPDTGWPDGHYRAIVRTPHNQVLDTPFTVQSED